MQMIKATHILSILTILFCQGINSEAQQTKNAKSPNIIFIMTDDQSPFPIESATTTMARPFGFCGDPYVHTPRIDSLANNGIIFTNAYVSSSVCSASRYSILTGRYAGRCAGTAFMNLCPEGTVARPENNTELEEIADRANLASLLQKAGYRTGFVGKSHIVDHHKLDRDDWSLYGFQTYAQDADPKITEVNAAMSFNHNHWVNRIKEFGFDYVNGVYNGNLKELYNDELNVHNLEWKNKAVLEFIDQSGDEPFFLYYSENIPHGPAPWNRKDGKYWKGLDADPGYSAEGYNEYDYSFMPDRQSIKDEVDNMSGKDIHHAWLTWFDYAVGSVIDKLKERGKFENTLIVITSDHGNYESGKTTIYEGGVKVPLMCFWANGIKTPSVYDDLVQNIDYAPTFLDLAGVSLDDENLELDGASLKNVFNGSTEPIHEDLYFEIGYARGVATKDWKYITVRYDDAIESKICDGQKFNGKDGAVLDAPYYVRNGDLGSKAASKNPYYFDRHQLFDRINDPWEDNNLYKSNEAKTLEMNEILQGYLDRFPNRPYNEFNLKCNLTDVNQTELKNLQRIKVFPSPAGNIISITGVNTGSNYAIFNVLGIRVSEGKLNSNQININKLKPGIYFFESDGNIVRFVKHLGQN